MPGTGAHFQRQVSQTLVLETLMLPRKVFYFDCHLLQSLLGSVKPNKIRLRGELQPHATFVLHSGATQGAVFSCYSEGFSEDLCSGWFLIIASVRHLDLKFHVFWNFFFLFFFFFFFFPVLCNGFPGFPIHYCQFFWGMSVCIKVDINSQQSLKQALNEFCLGKSTPLPK